MIELVALWGFINRYASRVNLTDWQTIEKIKVTFDSNSQPE